MPCRRWYGRPGPTAIVDYYNDRWYEYTGLPRGVGGDESWKSVLHPDDVQKCLDTWYAAVRSGNSYEIEYRLKNQKTGRYRWHLGRALPVKNGAGAIVRWIGTCTDIEDQKRAEENLRHSEEQFHTLVDSIPQLAWVARPDGHIYGYNKRWYDYTGKTAEQMEGWGWQTVHDQDNLPKVLERWKASLATGEPFDMVVRLRGADGQFRSFLTRCVPLRGPRGTFCSGSGQTPTSPNACRWKRSCGKPTRNWKSACSSARSNCVRPRRVSVRTNNAIARWWRRPRPSSGTRLPPARLNPTCPPGRFLPVRPRNRFNGWGWLDAVHPEDRAHTASAWSTAVATQSFYQVEHRLRRHDGEYRHMLARGVPIMNKEGAITRVGWRPHRHHRTEAGRGSAS